MRLWTHSVKLRCGWLLYVINSLFINRRTAAHSAMITRASSPLCRRWRWWRRLRSCCSPDSRTAQSAAPRRDKKSTSGVLQRASPTSSSSLALVHCMQSTNFDNILLPVLLLLLLLLLLRLLLRSTRLKLTPMHFLPRRHAIASSSHWAYVVVYNTTGVIQCVVLPVRLRQLLLSARSWHMNWTELAKPLCSWMRVFQQKWSQAVYWILAASKGWIKQTYRKIMHTQNTQYTQNHITGNDLVQKNKGVFITINPCISCWILSSTTQSSR